jgi:hypothetical protein
MQVQAYRLEEQDLDELSSKRQSKEDDERATLSKELGFKWQEYSTRAIPYPEFTGEELSIWREFLPTRYMKSAAGDPQMNALVAFGSGSRDIAGYTFDLIPIEALREMKKAKDMKVFSDIQIWTPEEISVDPMAVGVTNIGGGRFYQIVRWGESLKPFEEIREEVVKRRAEIRLPTMTQSVFGQGMAPAQNSIFQNLFGSQTGVRW